jgi:hypothetical protein
MKDYYDGRPPVAQSLEVTIDDVRQLNDYVFRVYATVKRATETRSLICYVRRSGSKWGGLYFKAKSES